MKTAVITITGVLGPGQSVTSLVFSDVSDLKFHIKDNTIEIVQALKAEKSTFFDYDATATVTYSISGDAATITISQYMRKTELGSLCKDCKCVITERIAVYKGDERYVQSRCKSCQVKHTNRAPSRTRRARARQYIEWRYGISYTKYNEMVDNQLNGCAICKCPCSVRERLSVDHNHVTNAVRDLLCHRCNLVLGLVNEDEDLFINMIEYLKRHNIKLVA